MSEHLDHMLHTSGFMPHGHCYLWQPALLFLQVGTNLLIGLSYVAISGTLAYLVYKIRDLPFQKMYVAFGVFIVACGLTHFMDIVVIWHPLYWWDGYVRAITAIASVVTAVLLPPLVPHIVAFARSARLMREQGIRFETAYRDLHQLFDRAKHLDEMKNQFVANISHELRTPLTLILHHIRQISAADNLDADQRNGMVVANRNARLLLKHVNDLLEIAKLDAKKITPKYYNIDFAKWTRSIAAGFASLCEQKDQKFQTETPEALNGDVDPDFWQRILMNLLTNAIKFTPSGGSILLRLSPVNSRSLSLEIHDSGPGIPSELREQIFERFTQIKSTKHLQFGGTGLGLSIVKELVLLLNGRIEVTDSIFGGGTCIRIEAPRYAPKDIQIFNGEFDVEAVGENSELPGLLDQLNFQVQKMETLSNHRSAATTIGSRPHVLIVEDNADLRQYVFQILSEDYLPIVAGDGMEALQILDRQPIDLIVTDLMMPIMSGDVLIEKLRANDRFRHIPIIILTARADEGLQNKLLATSVQDYLIKPFSHDELRARVKNLVDLKIAKDLLQKELDSKTESMRSLVEEVASRRKDLETSIIQLEKSKDQAEKALGVKSRFVGLMSHEVKTPLTALMMNLQMLKRSLTDPLKSAESKHLDLALMAASRSLNLMDSLLQLAHLQSGTRQMKEEEFKLGGLILEEVEIVKGQIGSKSIQLEIQQENSNADLVRSDPAIVRLILRNLLVNALKYSHEGRVRVAYDVHSMTDFQFCVIDSGVGIPAEHLERIFEPFEQLEPLEKKSSEGVGLGLAIVREAATAVGATIAVQSDVNRGTTFKIRFQKRSAATQSPISYVVQ